MMAASGSLESWQGLYMSDERVTLFQKFPLRREQDNQSSLAGSSSSFAMEYFVVIALCDGHSHRLEPLIDVHKFVC
jgi:hypothetical protein